MSWKRTVRTLSSWEVPWRPLWAHWLLLRPHKGPRQRFNLHRWTRICCLEKQRIFLFFWAYWWVHIFCLQSTGSTCFMCPDSWLPLSCWFEVRGRLLCEILHNPAFNSSTYKLAEKVPSKSFESCWDAMSTLESHVTAFLWYFRLQEAILLIPRGITVLMDMLMDREVSSITSPMYFLTFS